MARPLRMQNPGGWYHAMSRGIDRQAIYTDDRDREHFLELLESAVVRFRVRLHAYVLMDNHFHLLLETPEGNLGACMQWIKQSYSVWHNVRHDRVGPLFQGRYRSVPVEDSSWAFELSLYMHLNPLRLWRFKLSRIERQAENQGSQKPIGRREATRRLRELRAFRWSSYRAYGGYAPAPGWLTASELLKRAGGRDSRQSYRKAVMARLTAGEAGDALEKLRDALAVGTELFRERVRGEMREAGREIAGHHAERDRVPLEKVIKAVETAMGEPALLEKRGGLGRNLAIKIARDVCGMTLKQLGERIGGLDYVTVHMTIQRLEQMMHDNVKLVRLVTQIKRRLCNEKT